MVCVWPNVNEAGVGAADEGVVFPNEKKAPEDGACCEAAGVGWDDVPNAKADACATVEAS